MAYFYQQKAEEIEKRHLTTVVCCLKNSSLIFTCMLNELNERPSEIMHLQSKTPQESDWSIPQADISQQRQTFNEINSTLTSSNKIHPTNISQSQLENLHELK
jgi:hypothetical protein